MLEEVVPSIVDSVYGWCTPTVLFVVVNIVIGSIAVASKCSPHHHDLVPDDRGGAYPSGRFLVRSLSRSSSRVLDHLCSFSIHHHHSSGEIHPPAAAHASSEVVPDGAGGGSLVRSISRSPSLVLERLRSFDLRNYFSAEVPPSAAADHRETEIQSEAGREQVRPEEHLVRSRSDTRPTAGEAPPKLAVRMKKSASEKSAFAHFGEEEIEESMDDPAEGDEGGEVDARADDFINRFRQQLKLQRLNSILRYKEMISRGS